MKLHSSLIAAIKHAEELLAERKRIQSALASAEKEHPKAIDVRLDAEKHLAELGSAVALGQADEKVLAAAHGRLNEARTKLDAATARLRGLKLKAREQADDLASARQAIEDLMPQHRAAVQK